jgi:hypothetical protein
MAKELSAADRGCGTTAGSNNGFDRAAAPSNRWTRSGPIALAATGSSSCRTQP